MIFVEDANVTRYGLHKGPKIKKLKGKKAKKQTNKSRSTREMS